MAAMRIAYFCHVNGGSRSGVFHKIGGQVDLWRREGHEVRVFLATRDDVEQWRSRLGDSRVCRYAGPLSRLRAMVELVRSVRRFRPDVIYLRWDLFYPPMLAFPRRVPLVVDINTNDVVEYALGTKGRAIYNARTRGLVMGRARALVFISDDLSRKSAFRGFRATHYVITNGVDLTAYPSLPSPDNDRPRLVFVGSAGQPWHGLDKVLALARLRPAWGFDIVGMTEDEGSPPNVTWHGSLNRDEVIQVLAQADVGIGSLALHRNQMFGGSPLKVREYLAVGLPVLYAYDDADADVLDGYVLSIANTESAINDEIDRIDAFVNRSMGARVPRSSVGHISTAAKEQQRLALFEAVARA